MTRYYNFYQVQCGNQAILTFKDEDQAETAVDALRDIGITARIVKVQPRAGTYTWKEVAGDELLKALYQLGTVLEFT